MFSKVRFKANAGFTLLELLVVVAIIGVLASIIISAVGRVRASARDAKRIAASQQIQTAINLWENDKLYTPTPSGKRVSGSPIPDGSVKVTCNTSRTLVNPAGGECLAMKSSSDEFFGNINSDFRTAGIVKSPIKDPNDPNCYSVYITDGYDYELMSVLESDDTKMQSDGGNEDGAYESGTKYDLVGTWESLKSPPNISPGIETPICGSGGGGGGTPPPPPGDFTYGLVAHWKFDEAPGSPTAIDSAGSANGALQNGANFVSGGKSNNALTLDGVNDYVNPGNPASLQFTSSMTIAVWVKLSSIPSDGRQIIDKNGFSGPPTYRGWGLSACGDCGTGPDITDWFFRISSTGSDTISLQSVSRLTPTLNNWTHIVAIYNASAQTMDMYINGVLDNGTRSGDIPSIQYNSTYGPDIGNRQSELLQSNYFPGLIDDLRVYNRALSDVDVAALYASY